MKSRSSALPVTVALLAAVLMTAIVSQARATVTWSFFETGCSGVCTLPPQPHVFATLTLPSPISAGSASWPTGFPIFPGDPPPVHTGDDFAFALSETPEVSISSANLFGPSSGPPAIRNYDISWAATPDSPEIRVDILTSSIAEAHLGVFGGRIATDFILGGCENSQCQITGFWQNDLAVPEPSSASLVLAGLFGVWFGKRYRRRRRPNRRGAGCG
jgi:hypothetical protein